MHQWLVKRGRLGIWLDEKGVRLQVGAGGELSCLLTMQDTLDISGILADYGRELWEREGKPVSHGQIVQGRSEFHYTWEVGVESLDVFLASDSEFLQVKSSTTEPLVLSIVHVSEIAQMLQFVIEAVKKAPGTDTAE